VCVIVNYISYEMHPRIFQGLTLFLSYAILAAVLGMLQFGYNTGVINAPEVVRHKVSMSQIIL